MFLFNLHFNLLVLALYCKFMLARIVKNGKIFFIEIYILSKNLLVLVKKQVEFKIFMKTV